MRNNLLLLLPLSLLLSNPAVALPPPGIGVQWNPVDGSVELIGEITSDPGLEYIGTNEFAERGVFSLGSGQLLDLMPPAFRIGGIQMTLRDVDQDGLAEIVCMDSSGLSATGLGIVGAVGSDLQNVFPPIEIDGSIEGIDFMNLNASYPQALVVQSASLKLISPADGSVLYDSATDPDVGASWHPDTILIDDYDDDGYDEVLSVMTFGPDPRRTRTVLIGDLTVPSSAESLTSIGRRMLGQNWPNPANGSTRIAFELRESARVRLRVYDAAGRLVRTIADDAMPAGEQVRMWDGRDDAGAEVSSGIYFYELDVNGRRETRKLVQLR